MYLPITRRLRCNHLTLGFLPTLHVNQAAYSEVLIVNVFDITLDAQATYENWGFAIGANK